MNELSRKILKATKEGKIRIPEEKHLKVGKVIECFGGLLGRSTLYYLIHNNKVETFKINGQGTTMVNFQEVYDYFTKR